MKSAEIPNREKRELIVETWTKLGHAPVTARMLSRIQRALARQFGIDTADSPASIARVLADEGAELRHPDVIEFDAQWRKSSCKESELAIAADAAAKPLTLESAEALLKRFEGLRRKFSGDAKSDRLRQLREAALNEKAKTQLLARDSALDDSVRKVQAEIAEWFRVWLQAPEIFDDWLDLRKRSSEFRETFKAQESTGSV
jgi:hypothetical protein